MATRRPLVIIGGGVQELPVGDSLPPSSGTFYAIPVYATVDGAEVPELIYNKSNELLVELLALEDI